MMHCDLRVRWKVASDLRFRAAISEPKTPSFCGISGDLGQSTRKSLAIAIVRFWCAKVQALGQNFPRIFALFFPDEDGTIFPQFYSPSSNVAILPTGHIGQLCPYSAKMYPDLLFLAFLDFLVFFSFSRNSLLFCAFFLSFPGILGVRQG